MKRTLLYIIITMQTTVKNLAEACRTQKDACEAHKTVLLELEPLDTEKLLYEFDESHNKQPMYRWAGMYMRIVTVLLQFQHALREGNRFLYLGALDKLRTYFFAYNRLDYAQNILEYTVRMHHLETTDPETWDELASGNFTVNTSNSVPYTHTGIDQAMEHLNKVTKGQDGIIIRMTSSLQTLLKFCLTGPKLARLSEETERLVMIAHRTAAQQHHCLS